MKTFELYRPVGNYLLLEPMKAKEVTDAGIYIPEQCRIPLTQGTIVKLGKNVSNFKVGDTVIFTQHTEQPIEIDGVPYLLLDDSNVILVKDSPAVV